jgi:hypothetical protein
MSPDSVVLEIFFVRLPPENKTIYHDVWKQIDEQALSAELRRCLAANGFRAGVIGGQLPREIQQLLDQQVQKSSPVSSPAGTPADRVTAGTSDSAGAASESTTGLAGANTLRFDSDQPDVRIRQLQIRSGRRGEIIASGLYDVWPLLVCADGHVAGREYPKGQGLFAVRCFPQSDGRVRLEVTPEVHHGEPRQRFSGTDGVWRLETGRPRSSLDCLRMTVTLAPGEMLVAGPCADRPGTVGHYFLTEQTDGTLVRKLLFVRLAHTQLNDLFLAEP